MSSNDHTPNGYRSWLTIPANKIRPTGREIVVLEYLAQDLADKQIALRMCISPDTVRTHIKRLIALTRTNSRVGLAVTFIKWRYLGISNPYWDEPDIVYRQLGGKGNELS